MARPRKDQDGPSARERIVSAFWEMLEDVGYGQMTARALCSRAGVSTSTLYSHFPGGIPDVAAAALPEALIGELPGMVMAGTAFAEGSPLLEDGTAAYRAMHCMRLYAASGSPMLASMLRDAILASWLKATGVEPGDLCPIERVQLSFVLGGVIGVIGDMSMQPSLESFKTLFELELGLAIARTLSGLKEVHAGDARDSA